MTRNLTKKVLTSLTYATSRWDFDDPEFEGALKLTNDVMKGDGLFRYAMFIPEFLKPYLYKKVSRGYGRPSYRFMIITLSNNCKNIYKRRKTSPKFMPAVEECAIYQHKYPNLFLFGNKDCHKE